jgi:hypothetical protein
MRRAARGLKPGMLVGSVVDDQFGDDFKAPRVRLANEGPKVGQRAVIGMDVLVIGNVVAVIAHGRGIERHQPQRIHPQILEIIEPLDQARKSPMPSWLLSPNALTCS